MFHVEFFCVDVKHKSREILRNIVYTCILLNILGHCVFWQYDNLNHPGIMFKNGDIEYNKMYQQNNASCDEQGYIL